METSSSKELLRLIKVDEGKCKNETWVSFLFGASYFTTKALGTTFAIDAIVPRVRIVP
jgi:hypothetical protein